MADINNPNENDYNEQDRYSPEQGDYNPKQEEPPKKPGDIIQEYQKKIVEISLFF